MISVVYLIKRKYYGATIVYKFIYFMQIRYSVWFQPIIFNTDVSTAKSRIVKS